MKKLTIFLVMIFSLTINACFDQEDLYTKANEAQKIEDSHDPDETSDETSSTTGEPEINITYASGNVLSGDTVDFGQAIVNETSDITFTIENTGPGGLELSGYPLLSISGTNADQFSATQPPSKIGSMNSAEFTVCFTPTSAGNTKSSTSKVANFS